MSSLAACLSKSFHVSCVSDTSWQLRHLDAHIHVCTCLFFDMPALAAATRPSVCEAVKGSLLSLEVFLLLCSPVSPLRICMYMRIGVVRGHEDRDPNNPWVMASVAEDNIVQFWEMEEKIYAVNAANTSGVRMQE